MRLFQPNIEEVVADYLKNETGCDWSVRAICENLDTQFECTCGNWKGLTRAIDFIRASSGIEPYIDELIVYWHRDNESA